MTAITVSVGERSRSLAGSWVVVLGVAVAAVLVATGLVAGRWTAPAADAATASTPARYADPLQPRPPFRTTAYPCAVGRPC
jgi:hypothetical protein